MVVDAWKAKDCALRASKGFVEGRISRVES
jgi:hypothetical protein